MPPEKRIDALLFDMDGTLLDSVAVVLGSYASTVRRLANRPCSHREVTATFPVGPGSPLLGELLGRPCLPEDLAEYESQVRARLADARPYPGIPAAVAGAAARLPVGVYTGTDRCAAELLLANAGLRAHFSVLVCGDDVRRPKPDPEGLLLACHRLGVDPGSAAYLGDSPFDVRAARSGGLRSLTAGWGHQYDPAAPADLVLSRSDDLLAWLATETAEPARTRSR